MTTKEKQGFGLYFLLAFGLAWLCQVGGCMALLQKQNAVLYQLALVATMLCPLLAVLLVQRRWMLFFAAGTFFARIPLVFLTAPDTYFMYYLTPFIAGYAVAAAAVLYAVLKRKMKSERITG